MTTEPNNKTTVTPYGERERERDYRTNNRDVVGRSLIRRWEVKYTGLSPEGATDKITIISNKTAINHEIIY